MNTATYSGTGSIRKVAAWAAAVICAIVIAALFAAPALAYAAGDSPSKSRESIGFALGNDYVWVGESARVSDASVDNDILAAGRSVDVSDVTVGGSVRVAAQDVSLRDVKAAENVTIAGQTLSVEGGEANAVCMASQTATFSGDCSDLRVYANTVTVDGVVHGDVDVAGRTVEIGPNAVIDGTLHVTSSVEPHVASTAKVGELDVTIEQNTGVSSAELSGALASFSGMVFVFGIISSILGAFIIALLAEWLFKRHTTAAAEMIRTRTGATIGSGIIGALVAPIVIIVLCALVVTLPVAGALALALIAMTIVAEGFMGASVFKLAFPKLGRFACAMIGGAIMGVAGAIPFLGSLVGAAAFMYFLGYVIQTVFLSLITPTASQPAPVESAYYANDGR